MIGKNRHTRILYWAKHNKPCKLTLITTKWMLLKPETMPLQLLLVIISTDFWVTGNLPSQIALAHRKVDVKAINQTIREARIEAGELENGQIYITEHGRREFAAGDRILFTRNNRDIGVKNGMLGAVVKTDKHHLTIELDDKENGQSTTRTICVAFLAP